MNVFVTAGGKPGPEDPLYPITRGGPKAMLEVAGKPMIQWVLDALGGAENIDNVIIVGLPRGYALSCAKPLSYEPDHGGLLSNVLGGMEAVRRLEPGATHALYASADIPGMTAEMVDWRVRIALADPADVDYAAIERHVMEARFPTSQRTYVKLKDVEVCGADLNVVALSLTVEQSLWDRIIEARKSPLRQAALVGFDTMLLVLLRRLSLDQAARRIGKSLGLKSRAHLCPYAELGMDVDKPHQLDILNKHLSAHPSPA